VGLLRDQKRKKWQKATLGKIETKESILLREQQYSNTLARSGIALAVVFIIAGLVAEGWSRGPFGNALWFGLLAFLLGILGWTCFSELFPDSISSVATFHRLAGTVLGFAVITKIVTLSGLPTFFAPVSLLAMIATVTYSPYVGMYLVAAGSLLACFMDPQTTFLFWEDTPSVMKILVLRLPLLLSFITGGLVCVLGSRRIRSQSRPAITGFFAGLVGAVTVAVCDLVGSVPPYPERLLRPLYAFAGCLLGGVVMTSILPALEHFFDVLTERRLRELADLSNELLRTFNLRAPGSFTHSLNVAHLASEAAAAIGADPLLARVGAYYHDIGKILKPEYFVENIVSGPNPHDRLSPEMSRLVIVSHVKDGLSIAEEEKLPQKVAQMIPMHHGTTVVTYFYQKAKDQADAGVRHDTDIESYRYPGPKPTFKEAAVLMLADAVEAASRTIGDPTPARLKNLVHDIIWKRLQEGELDDSKLTMRDLRKIEESFLRTLSTQIFHGRIPYPEEATTVSRSRHAHTSGGRTGVTADKPSPAS